MSEFKTWYAKNAETLSEKRKKARRDNPALKKALVERTKSYESREHLPVEIDGVLIYNRMAAAQAIGVSGNTVCNWIKNGYIPDDRATAQSHKFTAYQVSLMQELSDFIKSLPIKSKDYKDLLHSKIQDIRGRWYAS